MNPALFWPLRGITSQVLVYYYDGSTEVKVCHIYLCIYISFPCQLLHRRTLVHLCNFKLYVSCRKYLFIHNLKHKVLLFCLVLKGTGVLTFEGLKTCLYQLEFNFMDRLAVHTIEPCSFKELGSQLLFTCHFCTVT